MACPPTLPHFQSWISRSPLQLDKSLPITITTVTPNLITGIPCTVFCYKNRRQSKRIQTNVSHLYILEPPWPMGTEIATVSDQHLPDKDPMFLTNNWRNLKWKIYFISASCYCFEHIPISIIDSSELLVMQDSSIIHNNIYTSKLFQSRLYDLVSIYNRIIVCYSLAICQEQNRPYCKAAITTMNHILERETGQIMRIYHIIVVHSYNHCCYGNTSTL